ncbi:ABC transporter permease [Agrobacterium vitis]
MTDLTPATPKSSDLVSKLPRINPLLAMCLFVMVAAICLAVFADKLAPYGFAQIDLKARKMPPLHVGTGAVHWFGTDEMGRDILSRIFYALRMSIMISLGAAIISMTIGTTLGLIAAFRRGLADAIIRVAVDFQASMPFIIIALTVLAFLGNSLTLFICLLGLFGWERFARLTRTMAGLELEKTVYRCLASQWRRQPPYRGEARSSQHSCHRARHVHGRDARGSDSGIFIELPWARCAATDGQPWIAGRCRPRLHHDGMVDFDRSRSRHFRTWTDDQPYRRSVARHLRPHAEMTGTV